MNKKEIERYTPHSKNILNKDLYDQFIKKYPKYKDTSYLDITNLLKAFKTNLTLGGVNRNENSYYWSSSEFGFFNNRFGQGITAFYINTTRGDFEYNVPIGNYFVSTPPLIPIRAVRKI